MVADTAGKDVWDIALIANERLHTNHLDICTQFVNVARSLYVDPEPHTTMARVRAIRRCGTIPPSMPARHGCCRRAH